MLAAKDHSLRKSVVRQDRTPVSPEEKCEIEIEGQLFSVLNYSPFGLALLFPQGEVAPDTCRSSFIFNDIEVSIVHLKAVRKETLGDGQQLIAYEVLGEPIHVELIEVIRDVSDLTAQQKTLMAEEMQIPHEFRRQVYEIKDWLESMRKGINSIETTFHSRSKEEQTQIEETVAQTVSDHLDKNFVPFLDDLFKKTESCDKATMNTCVDFFRKKLKELIYESPLAHRSISRPLGYAGDYEMMNIIYRNELVGTSLFGKCLHKYYIEKPAAQAVRNRADYLIMAISRLFEKKKEGPLKILSVASGPAMEIQRIISEVREYNHRDIEVHLLDQDVTALKHSQRRIYEMKIKNQCNFDFKFINQNIKHVITRGLEEKDYDLVYTAGVFDYFTDPVAQMAAQKMFDSVKSDGELIIGNFSDENPNEVEMKFFLDWDLIYRSEKDLHRLFGSLSSKLRVEKESNGINLFCVIEK